MIDKLTAQFAIVSFVGLTVIGILLKYPMHMEFSLTRYFSYVLLFVFMVIFLGKPFAKLAMDLIKSAYHDNEDSFKVPGAVLPPDERNTSAPSGKSTSS